MILYVTQRLNINAAADCHLEAIKRIIGESNIYIANVGMGIAESKDLYIAFGKPNGRAEKMRRWIEGNPIFISNNIIDELIRIIRSYSIKDVVIEDSFFGNFARKVKKYDSTIRIISFLHDIGADLFPNAIKSSSLPNKIEFRTRIKQERIQMQYSDINIVFCKRDAELFNKYYGRYPDQIIPLAVSQIPVIHTKDQISSGEKKELLFVGNRYTPNIDGIRWFYKNVLPSLSTEITLKIVGRGTEFLATEMCDNRVAVVGGVDDLSPYYANAAIVIVPIFAGGGMKMKTAEALSAGKYVIGTDEGFTGFWEYIPDALKNQKLFLCNTSEEWINTINSVCQNDINRFNEEIFCVYEEHNSIEATTKRLISILN